ncbi:hypothetical protein HDU78_010547 [Chytriomyces hyalinus]|nr:hypothetical protein HDU78_010547 [Chytriomyces hyalinus]
MRIVIGSWSHRVAILEANTEKGLLQVLGEKELVERPSWLCRARMGDTHCIVACSEKGEGSVAVYSQDGLDQWLGLTSADSTHELVRPVLQFNSLGSDPCHFIQTRDGSAILVANYNGGNVLKQLLHHSNDAAPLEARFSHIPCGPHSRQEASHPHMITWNPYEPKDSARIYVVDLGTDRIHVLDQASFEIIDSLSLPPGSGPRHIAFHPDGIHAYVVFELTSEVAVISVQPNAMQVLSHHSFIPPHVTEPAAKDGMLGAAILLSPDARFLYVSNRFDPTSVDTIAIFRVGDDAQLAVSQDGTKEQDSAVSWVATGGPIARGVAMSESGRWLCVANQGSGKVVLFERNVDSGALTMASSVELGADFVPTCCLFL